MRVRVLYFASFREAAGRDEELREIADRSPVSELWRGLAREALPESATKRQAFVSER